MQLDNCTFGRERLLMTGLNVRDIEAMKCKVASYRDTPTGQDPPMLLDMYDDGVDVLKIY